MQYMDYFSADDLDSVAYIEDDTNNVIIKFYGFPNKLAAELFIAYAMSNMGFNYQPISGTKSDMIHQIWILKYLTHQESIKPTCTNKQINTDGMYLYAIEDSAKQYV